MSNEKPIIVNGLSLTVLTKSSVALSNDQGYGTYTPIKKIHFDNALKPFASVSTFTYELKKILKSEPYKWSMSPLIIKDKNTIPKETEGKNEEADIFGYLLPDKQVDRKSPLRVIPLMALNSYKNTTNLITNRGLFDLNFGRKYFKEVKQKNGNKETTILDEMNSDEVKTTQAFVTEEVHGDYYSYTITLELNRVGRIEYKDGSEKKLDMNRFEYKNEPDRKKMITDILKALKELGRDIKHQNPLLRPLAVAGGIFESAKPYFWDRMKLLKNGNLSVKALENVITDYNLNERGFCVIGIDGDEFVIDDIGKLPVQAKDKDEQRNPETLKRPIKAIDDIIAKVGDLNWEADKKQWILPK